MGPIVDDINVVNMPFLFRNMAHAEKMMDGPIGQELLDKITVNANAGLVALCWMNAGARSLYNTKKPVKSIEDVKGLKFRVIGNPIFIDMMNALGGNGVAMGYDQVFSALQTGVIDGAENNPPSYVFSNHYTAAKYFSLTEHLIIPEVLVFSKRAWGSLSADDQNLIKKLAREAQMEERDLWNKYEQQAMEKAKAAGCQIVEVADKAAFQNAVKPVWDKYGPKYPGHDQTYPGYRVGSAASHEEGAQRNGRIVSPGDGLSVFALRHRRLHGAGADFSRYSLGCIHRAMYSTAPHPGPNRSRFS